MHVSHSVPQLRASERDDTSGPHAKKGKLFPSGRSGRCLPAGVGVRTKRQPKCQNVWNPTGSRDRSMPSAAFCQPQPQESAWIMSIAEASGSLARGRMQTRVPAWKTEREREGVVSSNAKYQILLSLHHFSASWISEFWRANSSLAAASMTLISSGKKTVFSLPFWSLSGPLIAWVGGR